MRRRELLTIFGGAAMAWPLPARAQQGNKMRHLGVLAGNAANDPVWQPRVAALLQGLAALNWKEDRNLRIDWRYGGGDHARMARFAGELVALASDVILAVSTPCVEELRRRTSTIPIVFAIITDPVGQGFVASLSRPGGNITGFTDFDTPMAGKWLGMLAQITPPVAHVAVLYNPATAPFAGLLLRAIEEADPSLAARVRAAQGAWPHHHAVDPRSRRRGDRMR
ncbi:putative ABC transport system substrate-binding protein [Rhizobiales bacterium GAS188]|nr:putative ABC transport system substrate-binding protein [Rhizobiales bacterium GAS188]